MAHLRRNIMMIWNSFFCGCIILRFPDFSASYESNCILYLFCSVKFQSGACFCLASSSLSIPSFAEVSKCQLENLFFPMESLHFRALLRGILRYSRFTCPFQGCEVSGKCPWSKCSWFSPWSRVSHVGCHQQLPNHVLRLVMILTGIWFAFAPTLLCSDLPLLKGEVGANVNLW